MSGIKTLLAAAAVVAMTGQSMAATYLCVEDVSTGLTWESGAWRQQGFSASTYLIRKVTGDDPLAMSCEPILEASGKSLTPVDRYGTLTSYGCYTLSSVGSEPPFASECTEYWTDESMLEVVSCDSAILAKFGFRPSGEFYVYSTGSITAGATDEIAPNTQRMSAFMSVGKCSTIDI